MSLQIHQDQVPLRIGSHGEVRVGTSRMLLELVILAYKQGHSPEEIREMYDALELADIYSVIGYYLRHTAEVDEYLKTRDKMASEIRQQIEAGQDREEIRRRLEGRLALRESNDASPSR